MKKRLIAVALAALLIVAALPSTSLAAVWSAYVYTSNGKGLNLRPWPSTDHDPIASIPFGAEVRVSGYVGGWAEIYYGEDHGYVMDRYLVSQPLPYPAPTRKPAPSPTQKPDPQATTSLKQMFGGFVAVDYDVHVRPSAPGGFVHMRWAPTKAADPIRDYYQDDVLHVIAQNTTWAQVVDPSTQATGFMMRSFLIDFRPWELVSVVGK